MFPCEVHDLFIHPFPLGEMCLAAHYLEAVLQSIFCYRVPLSTVYPTLMCCIKLTSLSLLHAVLTDAGFIAGTPSGVSGQVSIAGDARCLTLQWLICSLWAFLTTNARLSVEARHTVLCAVRTRRNSVGVVPGQIYGPTIRPPGPMPSNPHTLLFLLYMTI